jgi:predicted DNA-binding transcriptional regulator YafY
MDWVDFFVGAIMVLSCLSLAVQAVQARREQARAARSGEKVGSLWHHLMNLHHQREAERKAQRAGPQNSSTPFKPSLKQSAQKSSRGDSKPTRAIRTGWSIGEVEFAYEDAEGAVTYRHVTVHSVTATHLKGECHDRGEERTFRLDRIIDELTDCETGEILRPKSWAKQVAN